MLALQDNRTTLVLDPKLISTQFSTIEDSQKYWAAENKPIPYLSEYYELHVLQPVAKEDVVPRFRNAVPGRRQSRKQLECEPHG